MPSSRSKHRAKAVAQVLAGEQASVVAKRYKIDRSTVSRWVREDAPQLPTSQGARERTREQMAGLIYDTLADLLGAVRAQLQVAAGQEWLEKQTAGELASLLGTELDRAVRLLAGFRPATDDGDSLG